MPIALITVLAAVVSAVPPPSEQLRADCVQPTYATDMLVCADATLKARDDEMAALLARAGPAALAGEPPMLEPQSLWFRRRGMCAFEKDHRGCAIGAYEERIAVLKAMGASVDLAASRFACRASWRTEPMPATLTEDGVLIARIGAGVVAVDIAAPPRSVWQPYAALAKRTERELRVATVEGASLRCTAAGG